MGGTPKLAAAACVLLCLCACEYLDDFSDEPPRAASPATAADTARKQPLNAARPQEARKGLVGIWHDAVVGDWVQFLSVRGTVVVFTVSSVDEEGVDLRVENYQPDGTPVSTDTRRVDTTEYFVPPKMDRFSPVEVTYELPATGRALLCDRYVITTQERGEVSETVMCPEIRAGGIVFMRRSVTTYYVLLDFGDRNAGPRKTWDSRFVKELQTRYGRAFGENAPLEEDPPGGEPPEPPED